MLQGIDDNILYAIYPLFKPKCMLRAEKVFEQGDFGKEIYFIIKGSVDVMMLRPRVHTILFDDDIKFKQNSSSNIDAGSKA